MASSVGGIAPQNWVGWAPAQAPIAPVQAPAAFGADAYAPARNDLNAQLEAVEAAIAQLTAQLQQVQLQPVRGPQPANALAVPPVPAPPPPPPAPPPPPPPPPPQPVQPQPAANMQPGAYVAPMVAPQAAAPAAYVQFGLPQDLANMVARFVGAPAVANAPIQAAPYVPAQAAYAPAAPGYAQPAYAPAAPGYAQPAYAPAPLPADLPRLAQNWQVGPLQAGPMAPQQPAAAPVYRLQLPKINFKGMYNQLVARLRKDLAPAVPPVQPAAPVPAAPAAPAPAPAAPAAPVAQPAPPPITIDIVKDTARQYVAQHPEIANAASYEDLNAVDQLREGVIAALNARGYRAGRILGPDGKPYDQMVAFGNPNDPNAQAYRVTAGGGPIRQAIEAGYSNDPIAWSDVH